MRTKEEILSLLWKKYNDKNAEVILDSTFVNEVIYEAMIQFTSQYIGKDTKTIDE